MAAEPSRPVQAARGGPSGDARRTPPAAADPAAPVPPGGGVEPPDRLTAFQQAVVDLVGGLDRGEVLTYAEVATEIGRPGSAQAVANVLRRVPGLPWWRVIPSDGRIYRTHAPTQVPLLRREGIEVDADRHVGPSPSRRSTTSTSS